MDMDLQFRNKDDQLSFKKQEENRWVAMFKGQKTEYTLLIEQDDQEIFKLTTTPRTTDTEDEKDITFFLAQIDKLNEEKASSKRDGIEDSCEDESSQNQEEEERNPYDPEKIRVDTKNFSIVQIYSMMTEDKEIDLSPDFQREFVWLDNKRKSRLIESIMLRIPLPVFYFSEEKNGVMQVVDGVQRLTVIKDFLSGKFKLSKLEYLDKMNGKYFPTADGTKKNSDILNPKFVRRIKQTQLSINIIDPESPSRVKFDIFKRINSGGKQLNPQEIRNCMAAPDARSFIKELAGSDEFKKATDNSVNDTRMAAQKLVMRFIGFYYLKRKEHDGLKYSSDIEDFLNNSLEILNKLSPNERDSCGKDFKSAMKNAYHLFGKYAFRKVLSTKNGGRRPLINKSLFTTWSVFLSAYSTEEVKERFPSPNSLLEPIANELAKKGVYYDATSLGTNSKKKIRFGI